MKKTLIASAMMVLACIGCNSNKTDNWTDESIETASQQLLATADKMDSTGLLPRSIWTVRPIEFIEQQTGKDRKVFADSLVLPPDSLKDKMHTIGIYDWTSGFFPGSLWYAYELTGNERLKEQATRYTNMLAPLRDFKLTHDIGFMVNCSFGNALRLAPNDTIQPIITSAADNLCARFDKRIGCIRSWDFGRWNFPVIIDNMMNLDLLFNAWHLTGDKKYYDVAVTHALTTMRHHFRKDYTCYHVVSYNNDGTVEERCTHQGKNDASAWARGQAWAVYGYTLCYRETKDKRFLTQAVNVADMIMSRVKTDDCIPYWDYDAPVGDDTPRDASAAAVTASAMLELCTLAPDGKRYSDYAEKILRSLSSDKYLAKTGKNMGFVLMHSTGSLPHDSEIDSPLNYADYYYLEAMQRYLKMKK